MLVCNTALMEPPEIEFIYVGDAMCSWCWGFAPVMDRLAGHYSFPMRLINGGLRPGPDGQPMEPGLRSYLLHHWEQVEARSGQPFNPDALPGDGWRYDTELPARAVVTMRSHAPEMEFRWFKHLQRSFYLDGVDVTRLEVYRPLLDGYTEERDQFMADLADESSRLEAWSDFEQARAMQATGFPTLLLRTGSDLATVTRGYAPFESIEPHLTVYLEERYASSEFLA